MYEPLVACSWFLIAIYSSSPVVTQSPPPPPPQPPTPALASASLLHLVSAVADTASAAASSHPLAVSPWQRVRDSLEDCSETVPLLCMGSHIPCRSVFGVKEAFRWPHALLKEAAQLLLELQGHVSFEVLKCIGKKELGLLKAVKDVNMCSSVCRSASQREKTFHVLLVLCRSVRNDYRKTFRCSCCFVRVLLLLLLFCLFVFIREIKFVIHTPHHSKQYECHTFFVFLTRDR